MLVPLSAIVDALSDPKKFLTIAEKRADQMRALGIETVSHYTVCLPPHPHHTHTQTYTHSHTHTHKHKHTPDLPLELSTRHTQVKKQL